MKKNTLIALSLTGGLMSGLAWSSWCTGLILLVSLVPFFLIENFLFENKDRFSITAFFTYALPGILIFNIMTLVWIRAASITAAVTVILGQTFFMSLIMWLIHFVRMRAGDRMAFYSLLSFWATFEFLTLNIVILSPWVNLGNGLAKDIRFIQWYEITGVAGGTLWILLSNFLLFSFLKKYAKHKKNARFLLQGWILLLVIPSAASMIRFYTITPSVSGENETVIVQPDIDPFTEKFNIPFDEQLAKVIDMAEPAVTKNTAWVIAPETFVADPVNEDDPDSDKYVLTVTDFAQRHPGINFIGGFVGYRKYPGAERAPTITARRTGAAGEFQDHFNSAFQIDSGGVKAVYHKSKLVPGIERQFSSWLGKLITYILPDLGGMTWGYGTQEERSCFTNTVTGQVAGPVICYESVYGNYVAGYVRNGAEALFIITNDGWWKNTNGYKHHLAYASLRAIETRRQIARSANTGISCIIDIRGKRLKESGWRKEAVIRGRISSETRKTPYVLYGDYLSKLFSVSAVIILLFTLVSIPLRKKMNPENG